MSRLNEAVTSLKGVGEALALKLARLKVETVEDLLFHLPLRYQDRTRITPIATLRGGHEAVVEGDVSAADVIRGRRRSLLVRLKDGSGILSLRFFHFSPAQQQQFRPGTRVRAFGEARAGATGLEIYHPEYRLIGGDEPPVEDHLTPIYPTTEGLHQARLRALIDQAMAMLEADPAALPDYVPDDIRQQFSLVGLQDSLKTLHHPPPDSDVDALSDGRHPASRRLATEELLAHQLSLREVRLRIQSDGAPCLPSGRSLKTRFLAQLPFSLTGAQRRVLDEIGVDLAKPAPMLRLVQGDVGSGKTVVAAMAALTAIAGGCQAAIMAPTELLAEQHYRAFRDWFSALDIDVAWLSGKLKGKARLDTKAAIADGRARMIVGTHAIFQDDVSFDRLGLAIIDEQHRFGVHQRLALREKGEQGGLTPHQLVMTATPIPRTLAMSAYADLDVSVIDELPPGRTPVTTAVVPDERRPDVIARIRNACAEGRQAYWVCTLIEESEALTCQAAEVTHQELTEALPELSIGLVHGRMKAADKAATMAAFKGGELDLLVATTVIEVGVDVPNASLMIIENPERLGLSQLHQLRGRVGRGSTESYCVLLYHPPLSNTSKQRLAVMRETTDGFRIAERDLEIRGPGEVLGTRQTGLAQMKIADLERDADLLPQITPLADALLARDPGASRPLIRRWLGEEAGRYGQV
ncbi:MULTISPECIES: ATP-dependent DNA helicase RecG [Halomonas]|uniref:ATP-dependent DNA helicase RecG n=1 Tax=Halomonas TaxID=2745 RepID=UPI001C97DE7E|nr:MULTISPECIES: ATP-dependent DNA helicase RecG [Halomonas]MED5295846.1 ATP-dependent DNA helicase RecG [Pseudomonadota bacterium]MBY5967962.1 ATP-dependent DNA helicase RecG [Halomonas denitrificans]MBY6206273.1 ATP-dependent DNA helicase RecG [Halomonas sp. DP3Y7-2]MBY6227836.1 ATP-dependent DNA helicase RecG [Halomonas sp. DP3Y7-1]MCA0915903.1 ATP-dependent DNA helicase RecG [Halomonas denitrificans]